MLRRIVIVMLLILTGCAFVQEANISTPLPQETPAPIVPGVVVPLNLELSYVVPDPDGLWTLSGTILQASNIFTTRIHIDVVLKPEDNTPLSDVLPTLTAGDLEIQEADGVHYAEGTTPVSDYVMYVDKGAYVMIFTLIDAASDDIAAIYISSWRSISLEGRLVEME